MNGNGLRETGDGGLTGWTITATGPVTVTTTSAAGGNYSFTGLPAGTYTLTETVQSGWVQTSANPIPITISVGSVVSNVDFGNFALGKIKGYKFEDLNQNGVKDTGEQKLSGWTIILLNGGTATTSTTTDSTGNYTFDNVEQGTYTVSEIQQPG